MKYEIERTSGVPCAVKECRFFNTTIAQRCDCIDLMDLQPFLPKCERYVPARTDQSAYYELLNAVGRVFPGESRHETALRYIREASSIAST